MSDNSLTITLVLTRGPEAIARRMTVHVPLDGSPVTVGRAPHCHVVLDPRLIFTSQVQCNLYCVAPSTASLSSTPARTEMSTPHTPDVRLPMPRLFISDLCSSNGTFVNRRRIDGTDPVELKDGDAIIFGGMRDIEVGECIPEDAFDRPELVVWCVDGLAPRGEPAHAGATTSTDYGFEATPMLLPTKAALDEAERALLQTALQSLRSPALEATPAETPSARARHALSGGGSTGGRPSFSPADVPQALFTGDGSPAPPTVTKAPRGSTNAVGAVEQEDGADAATRRSGTVPARLPLSWQDPQDALTVLDLFDAPALSVEAPAPVHFHALRLGTHNFHVAESALLGTCVLQQQETTTTTNTNTNTTDMEATPGKKHARTPSPSKNKSKKGHKAPKREEDDTPPTSATPVTTTTTTTTPCTLESLRRDAPFTLAFTHTHWKWTMDTPQPTTTTTTAAEGEGDGTAKAPLFHALLPITSIESVLVCAERCGVAVELKEGRQLPLVDAAVMAGGPENRWVVFLLEACQLAKPTAKTASDAASVAAKGKLAPANQKTKKGAAKPSIAAVSTAITPDEADTTTEPIAVKDMDFASWVSALGDYYSSQKFPTPLFVDAADFDIIYAPPSA